MDKYSIANSLLSEGYEVDLNESQVVVDFLTNAAIAFTMGTLAWNTLKGKDEPTVLQMIKDKYKEIKNKQYEGKTPMERVRMKLSKAINDSEVFIHDVFNAVAHKKLNADDAASKIGKKLKFDEDEHGALAEYLSDIGNKLRSIEPLLKHDNG